MTTDNPRRLAAIMFTDMVGYSALMQQNEAAALELLDEHNRLVRAILALHAGREIKTVGDAFLVEFDSALQAVHCAVRIQDEIRQRNEGVAGMSIAIRVGIHLGDVVYRENDVFGDGVNIAARVQSTAGAGEIRLSEDVARQVGNKIDYPLVDLGTTPLKNIAQPVRLFAVQLPWVTPIVATPLGPSSALKTASKSPTMSAHRLGVVLLAVTALGLVGGGGWWWQHQQNKALFVAESVPRIDELAQKAKYFAAYQLAMDVSKLGGAAVLTPTVMDSYSRAVTIESSPIAATIEVKPYGTDGAWITIGKSPLAQVRVPRGPLQWRASLESHRPATLVSFASTGQKFAFELPAQNAPDADMVAVSAGRSNLWALLGVSRPAEVKLASFKMDRTETSNRDYQRFVQAGGYTKIEYWKHAFRDAGRELTFDAAMQRFRDATGRPGPATWKQGSFPDGEEDLPVRGISWYEAAAYAAFAGKQLPTLHHWYWAENAGDLQYFPGMVLPLSNLDARMNGPRKVADGEGLGAFGTFNMSGNVREWVSNVTDTGKHLMLGGSWSDPNYLYLFPEKRSAFDRSPENGMRCMKATVTDDGARLAAADLKELPPFDFTKVKPATDAEYAIITRFFERRPVPLNAKVESTDESSKHWIRHRVSFAAGYGDERITALVYLPRNARPPYQTLIQMPGLGNFYQRTWKTDSDYFGWGFVDMMLRGGRAMVVPMWKGSYDRFDGFQPGAATNAEYRGRAVQWVAELSQTIDYLQSQPDMDPDRIGYHGISFGATWGPVFLALEPRIKTGILVIGGIVNAERTPDISPVSYAPRVRMPVLMLNGRHDPIFPYETSQVPLFNLLATPPAQKRHSVYPGGHSVLQWFDDMVREHYEWLDTVFGPVSPVGGK